MFRPPRVWTGPLRNADTEITLHRKINFYIEEGQNVPVYSHLYAQDFN